MSGRSEDQDLAARAGSGDESAFRELYRAHVRPVYWIAHGILSSAADAEDVTQETFVTAWHKLPGLELAGSSLLPWLATICRFHAANRLRRRRRDQAHTTDAADENVPDTVNVEEQVITTELAQRIADEVWMLGELDREIFRLCAVEGYAYRAAAERFGVSSGVVRNRLSRVRSQLRGAVEEARDA